MRKLKIATIVFLTGTAICLSAVLYLSLSRGYWWESRFGMGSYSDAQNPGNYSLVLEKEVDAESVLRLKIDYGMASNDVYFYPTDGDSILIREYMNFKPQENQISLVEQKEGELSVKGVRRKIFSFFSILPQNAYTEIYVPAGLTQALEELYVKTISGEITSDVSFFTRKNFYASSTSGDILFPEINSEQVRITSTSGNIRLANSAAEKFNFSTTSGDIYVEQAEGSITVSTTSGNVTLVRADGDIRISTTSGDDALHEISYRVPADRIVAGTYLAACLCSGGEIYLQEAPYMQMKAVMHTAVSMGAEIHEDAGGIQIICKERRKMPQRLITDSYPGFPTDLQSAFLTAMALAQGEGVLEETIFENRFRIVPELVKMGAHIRTQGNVVFVKGVEYLHGACLDAEELRGGSALVLAGAAADGMTIVRNRHYIERGYEDICKDLQALGVKCGKMDSKKQDD